MKKLFIKREKIKCKEITILSLLLSFFAVIGISFTIESDCSLIFGSLKNFVFTIFLFLLLFFLFKIIINLLFRVLNNLKLKKNTNTKDNKLSSIFNKHPFIYSFLIIIICWLPYIIAFCPAILSPDPSNQIRQFYKIKTEYNDYAISLNDNVYITNHHPIAHTILLGVCTKLGDVLFNSQNTGLFIYSVIQIIIFASVLSYTIVYLKELKIPEFIHKVALLIYAFVPAFAFYSMTAVKDTIFSSFIILYIIHFYNFFRSKEKINKKEMILTILTIFFVILFRNNGIYVVILSFPFLLLLRKNSKQILLVILISCCFYFSYDKVLLPALNITPGSIREVLSIPFQQTARYVKYHSDELTLQDIKNIDKILEYDTIASRYTPELADPVKNKFNKYTSKEDFKNYFKTWSKGLVKHPGTYIEATINNTYGYFYPGKINWYIYYKFDDRLVVSGFDYRYNSFGQLRYFLALFGLIFPFIPALGFIVNIGFNVWIILFMLFYLLYRKRKEWIILTPSLISILICFASPANCYFRYAMPYVFSMPLLIGIFIHVIINERSL